MIEDYISISDDENPSEIELKSDKRKNGKRKQSQDIEIIVLDEEYTNNNNYIKQKPIPSLDRIYKENRYFANFLEKCLELENSDGMTRIINRTLIGHYERSDLSYRNSPEFKKVMLKSLHCLEVDPDHKFSHVKDLVETLKLHVTKKRVQLTTLATNLNGNFSKKRCIKNGNSVVIDLNCEEREDTVINLDDEQNDVIVLDENADTEEKENKNTQNGSQDNNLLMPRIENTWSCDLNSNIDINDGSVGQVLPIEYEPETSSPSEGIGKVRQIELQIAWLKKMIIKFEEAEVDDDTVNSPYIMCEKYKARVVALYKELCELTGSDAVKRRQVRLKVLEGHPVGPVKRLERFINDNIGDDGMPLFPDFCDVIQCVVVANVEDKLGWNKQQVMREASSLFTQCGRALQKQRQRREYRDLLSRVKLERMDYDPADEDPALQARLEANRRIAIKKETDLLERYANMQYVSQQKSKSIEIEPPPDHSNCIIEDSDEDSNFEPPVPLIHQQDINILDKTDDSSKESNEHIENKELEVNVKQEPMDIIELLENLGDDFTMSVVDIEDPLLVIEIDSSDDEASTDNKEDGTESDLVSTVNKKDGIESDLTSTGNKKDGTESDLVSTVNKKDRTEFDLASIDNKKDGIESDLTSSDNRMDGIESDLASNHNKMDGIEPDLAAFDNKTDRINIICIGF